MEQLNIMDELIGQLTLDEPFTLTEAYKAVTVTDKKHSVRARIYEGVADGIFKKVARGVYALVDNKNNHVVMIEGNGRDLSMLEDDSIDCIITDHPYSDKKSNKGGNRSFADYESFQYQAEDFKEKARVLKNGAFLVEFFAEENANNYEYIHQCKQYAKEAGLDYYTSVNWKKGSFVANTGRKAKNTEQMVFFTKGPARALRLHAKKNLETARKNGLIEKKERKDSQEIAELLKDNNLEVHCMSGTSEMLPTVFDVDKTPKKEAIHQAEKPVLLFEQLIGYITKENEYILDQFSGSGNLGLACLKKGRNAILIEKNKETYDSKKEHPFCALAQ